MASELKGPAQRPRKQAMTIVELLVALVACSTILVGLVAAIRATTNTVNANEWYARTTIRGRNALVRMIDQVRTADAHQPYTSSACQAFLSSAQPVTDTGIYFADSGAVGPDAPVGSSTIYFRYHWDQQKKQLLVEKLVGNTLVATGVLLDGVINFQVTLWPAKSNPANPTNDIMLRAAFVIQYTDTDPTSKEPHTLALSGSVVPRKNGWSGQKLAYSVQTYLDSSY